ncbi:hypothetical protein ES695_12330 [Candidatus Atribacteria bacterium 1244-E10-H5-B2]|nr:MAG: hypothetical protein ES695_12330 [Candidatus Atribacteria bacterium 1244-E10-H5-B2]
MKQIGQLDITDNKRLILSIGEFRDNERVDLRLFVKNDDNEFIPTRKGINFNSEWIDKFVKMINKLNDV